jgi:protein-disulfide isomerase
MEETEEVQEVQPKKQPAITINIQSWATPVVGVVMLMIGLLAGYYGRPLIGGIKEQAAVPQSIAPSQAGAGNEELMAYLVSQTRHFTGNPDAPVTLIEFGDFQ